MLTTDNYSIPYPDPTGYDIVSALDIQLIAEVASAALAGFDALTPALLRRPTLIRARTSDSSSWVANDFFSPGFQTTLYDNTTNQAIFDGAGEFQIDSTLLNPECFVLVGVQMLLGAVGTCNAGTYREARMRVNSYAGIGSGVLVKEIVGNSHETCSGGEALNAVGVVRLHKGWTVQFGFIHGNTGSNVVANADSKAFMTYLMPAGS